MHNALKIFTSIDTMLRKQMLLSFIRSPEEHIIMMLTFAHVNIPVHNLGNLWLVGSW